MPAISVSEEISALRERGVYFWAVDFGLIEISGQDAPAFLQSQTTNDVIKLGCNAAQLSCLLDRKAHVRAIFRLFKWQDAFYILTEKYQIPPILEQFEAYKFNDKVDFIDLSKAGSFFAIQGPQSLKLLRQADCKSDQIKSAAEDDIFEAKLSDIPVRTFRQSVTGEQGYFFWVDKSQSEKFRSTAEKACIDLRFIEMSDQALYTARVEAGLPKFNVDYSTENLLPEIGLEELAASYSKGCFLGQEVLARVKSHGAPSRALIGLSFSAKIPTEFPLNSKLIVNGEEAALLKSNGFSPSLNSTIALAFIKRDYRIPNKILAGAINDTEVQATVTILPFYKAESPQSRACRLYEKALTLFAGESDFIVESESVCLLREALELDPLLEDAYETLGVILSKRGQLDAAIILMKKLVEINPDSVMAHTNLSVFYMQQGLKDEAEEEKAISMSIRMRLAAKQADLAKQDQQQKQKQHQETLERMEMFTQVLAIDNEDLLANYGLGSCLVDLEQFEQAIPYLVKAISIKPTHTVAYSALAAAYEAVDQKKAAMDVLEKGIEVASKRGDMTPLHQMQEKLAMIKNIQSLE